MVLNMQSYFAGFYVIRLHRNHVIIVIHHRNRIWHRNVCVIVPKYYLMRLMYMYGIIRINIGIGTKYPVIKHPSQNIQG
jgi:hypothetical protein